jgi:alkylation response protein AidB-like acyl-CoA dehydrogenase
MTLIADPPAGTRPPPTPQAAIETASALAAGLRETAAERDRDPSLAVEATRALAGSGLLGITVPGAFGGPALAPSGVVEVLRILASADGAVAASVVSHFVIVDALIRLGDDGLRAELLPAVASGKRIGGTCGHRPPMGTLARHADHALVIAEGYHGNGARGADWVGASVEDESGRWTVALIPGGAPGLQIGTEPWSFGQRAGTVAPVSLDQVVIPLRNAIPEWRALEGPTVRGSWDQLLHTAVDIGIARGALDAVCELIRPQYAASRGAGDAARADATSIVDQLGELASEVIVVEAALRGAAEQLDATLRAGLDKRNTAELSIAGAAVKAAASRAVLRVTSAAIELAGIEATRGDLRIDRYWRNARTHTLHDPVRWKHRHIGEYVLRGAPPPLSPLI